MLLVLCDASDVGALWAGLGLRSRCPDVEIVSTEELGSALRYDLRLDQHHRTVRIDLADGRTISSAGLSGVLNRLQQVPAGQVGRAAGPERTYAQAEFEALHVSWLAALDCPVINRPRPHGLCGAHRSSLEWAMLATRAGLPTDRDLSDCNPAGWGPNGWDSRDRFSMNGAGDSSRQASLIVIDDVVTGSPVTPAVADAARRLLSLSDERVIGITLHITAHGPRFAAATAVPDFRLGGEPFIEALAQSLQGHPTSNRLRSPSGADTHRLATA